MGFNARPFVDIKRTLFIETINLLKYHNILEQEYEAPSNRPDCLIDAIRQLNPPRNTQVEFLWKFITELESSQVVGFTKDNLDDKKRAVCFTGIVFIVLEQIKDTYYTYPIRNPNSHLYEGLQRVIGLRDEIDDKNIPVKEVDPASKFSCIWFACKFLYQYIYKDNSLEYLREETPFSKVEGLNLLEVFKKALVERNKAELKSVDAADCHTKAEQKAQQNKEKHKGAEQRSSKSYFRIFSGQSDPHPQVPSSEGLNKEFSDPSLANGLKQ